MPEYLVELQVSVPVGAVITAKDRSEALALGKKHTYFVDARWVRVGLNPRIRARLKVKHDIPSGH